MMAIIILAKNIKFAIPKFVLGCASCSAESYGKRDTCTLVKNVLMCILGSRMSLEWISRLT